MSIYEYEGVYNDFVRSLSEYEYINEYEGFCMAFKCVYEYINEYEGLCKIFKWV